MNIMKFRCVVVMAVTDSTRNFKIMTAPTVDVSGLASIADLRAEMTASCRNLRSPYDELNSLSSVQSHFQALLSRAVVSVTFLQSTRKKSTIPRSQNLPSAKNLLRCQDVQVTALK